MKRLTTALLALSAITATPHLAYAQNPVTITEVEAHATDDRRVNITANNASSWMKLRVWHCGGSLGPLCSTSTVINPPANDNTAFVAPATDQDGVISGLRYQFRIAGCSDNAGNNCPEAANPIITEGASKPESPGWIMTTPDETSVGIRWGTPFWNQDVTYEVGYNTDTTANAPTTSTVVRQTDDRHTFTGLAANTNHKFFARATVRDSNDNAVLEGAVSAYATTTVSTTNPPNDGAPTIQSITKTSTGFRVNLSGYDSDTTHHLIRGAYNAGSDRFLGATRQPHPTTSCRHTPAHGTT